MTGTVSTGLRGRAQEMLSAGLPATVVAARLGVTDSTISQMLSDPDFAEAVETARLEATAEDQKFDSKLEETESQALDNIAAKIRFGNLQQSLAAFKVLNGAKRRKDNAQLSQTSIGTAVQINMPTVLMPVYLLNQRSEIVEVDGQTMISASPKRMEEIVRERMPQTAIPLAQKQLERAKDVLEGMVRSVVQPQRRPARQVQRADLVDLL